MPFTSRTRGLSRRATTAVVAAGLVASAVAAPTGAAQPTDYGISNAVPGFVSQATDLARLPPPTRRR